jgi:hypothetical protein
MNQLQIRLHYQCVVDDKRNVPDIKTKSSTPEEEGVRPVIRRTLAMCARTVVAGRCQLD